MNTSAGCSGSGSAPSYSHQAGDQFVFKGGVTWPAACFGMSIPQGGSSDSNRDVYTANQGWYNGNGFSRPMFAGQGQVIEQMIEINASNITLSTLDIGGENVGIGPNTTCGNGVIYVAAGLSNVMVTQSKLHDWIINNTNQTSTYNHNISGMCYQSNGSASTAQTIVLDHSEVSDLANTYQGAVVPFGACAKDVVIQFTKCHDLLEGTVGFASVHDSELYNLNYPNEASALNSSGAHLNTIEADTYEGDGDVYNNYIHDTRTYGENISVRCSSAVFNNIMTNVGQSPLYGIGPGQGESSCNGYLFNNIGDGQFSTNNPPLKPPLACGGGTANLMQANNICIGGNLGGMSGYLMSAGEAKTYGYVAANKYFPTSADPNIVAKGTTLQSLVNSNVSPALGMDAQGAVWFGGTPVQRTTSWNFGPFQSGNTSGTTAATKPSPPTSLSVVVQ